jgi:hypothetical protein
MAWCNLIPPPHNELYESLRVMSDRIIAFARESCDEALEEIPAKTVISYDGSWDHRRDGSNCIVSIFAQSTKKIIAFACTSRKVKPESLTYCRVAQSMEVAALKLMIPRLQQKPNIVGFVHDHDGRTSKAIKDASWFIEEHLDMGHAMKSFERAIQSFNSKNNKVLAEVQDSLTRFLKILLHFPPERAKEKRGYWLNVVNHFCGDHRQCLGHRPVKPWSLCQDTNAVGLLTEFVQKTQWIPLQVTSQYSTQLNESFNQTKATYADKNTCWGFTWEARMACAVLDRNVPNWKLELYENLGLPKLADGAKEYIMAKERRRLARKERVKSRIRKVAWQRMARKMQEQLAKPDYKPNPYHTKGK